MSQQEQNIHLELFNAITQSIRGERVYDYNNYNIEKIESLLTQGADPTSRHKGDQNTALHYVAQRDLVDMLDLFFKYNNELDVNVTAKNGNTPLFWAVEKEATEAMEWLCKKNADVQIVNNKEETALMWAAANNQVTAMECFLNKGADIINQEKKHGTTAFMWAAEKGHIDAMECLYTNDNNVINQLDKNDATAFMWAASSGATNAMEWLVEKNKNIIDQLDENGATALMWAASGGATNAMEWLVENGADVKQRDKADCTLLMHAVEGTVEGVKWVIDRLEDEMIITTDKEGYNVMEYVTGKEEAIRELLQPYFSKNESTTISSLDAIKDLINNGVSQLILTGAPGTGKTYTAKNIAKDLGAKLPTRDEEVSSYCFVQFHPSYDYTDFVEGLRPVSIENNVTFKKIDGIFKSFCRKVVAENKNNEKNRDKKYFFIIDEINRADLSNVLGELMFCLEKDKRGESNRVQTQYSNLPTWDIDNKKELEEDCFAEGFYIPENVVIVGTMNDIDRSVESFDFALRRRFTWFEVEVTEELLLNAFLSFEFEFKDADELKERVHRLNNTIVYEGRQFGLNKHYFISQGYFTNIPDDKIESVSAICDYVWNYRLKSLLEEYIRGEDQESISGFIESCENAFLGNNQDQSNKQIDVNFSDADADDENDEEDSDSE